MVLKGFGKFIGTQAGTGQRGPWYNANFSVDGEPVQFRATAEVYNQCLGYEFGHEATLSVDCRLYQGSWILRLTNVED